MTNIRLMVIEDYAAVIGLWQSTEGMTLRDADSKDNIHNYLVRNPNLSFVALEGKQIIGAVLAGTDGRRGYLQHLVVRKGYRSNGVGKMLVNAVLEALKAVSINKTHLFVHNSNEKAQEYYFKSGWVARDEVRMFSFNNSENVDI